MCAPASRCQSTSKLLTTKDFWRVRIEKLFCSIYSSFTHPVIAKFAQNDIICFERFTSFWVYDKLKLRGFPKMKGISSPCIEPVHLGHGVVEGCCMKWYMYTLFISPPVSAYLLVVELSGRIIAN